MADTTVRRDGRARAGFLTRLYTGTGAFDVVGRRKLWYVLFGTLVLVCIGSIVFRGFNLGIDFTGGTQIQFPAAGVGGAGHGRGCPGRLRAGDRAGARGGADRRPGCRRVGADPLRAAGRRPDRRASTGPVRPLPAGRQRRAALRVSDQHHRRQRDLGWPDHPAGAHRARGVPGARHDLPGVLLRARDGRRRAGRPRPRRRGDDGRLLARRVRGHARHGDRPAHDPGLLALRHRRGVRQGQGEHARAARAHPPDLRRGGEPRAEPDADALDQHLADRGAAGAGPDGRRRRAARGRHARRPRARADRRHPRRRGVVGAAGDPDPGRPQAARPAHPRAGAPGRRPPRPGGHGGVRGDRRVHGRRAGPERRRRWPASCGGSVPWPPRRASPAAGPHRQPSGRPARGHGRRGRDADDPRCGRRPRRRPAGAGVRPGPCRPRLPGAGGRVPRHHPGAGRRRRPSRPSPSRSRRCPARPTSSSASRHAGSCSALPRR